MYWRWCPHEPAAVSAANLQWEQINVKVKVLQSQKNTRWHLLHACVFWLFWTDKFSFSAIFEPENATSEITIRVHHDTCNFTSQLLLLLNLLIDEEDLVRVGCFVCIRLKNLLFSVKDGYQPGQNHNGCSATAVYEQWGKCALIYKPLSLKIL